MNNEKLTVKVIFETILSLQKEVNELTEDIAKLKVIRGTLDIFSDEQVAITEVKTHMEDRKLKAELRILELSSVLRKCDIECEGIEI